MNATLRTTLTATKRLLLSSRCHAKRAFFASSTDHTNLLKDAQVHKLVESPDLYQLVLVPQGTDDKTVQTVPQLHLARLYVENNTTMRGAKVINRTLGSPAKVCSRLVDHALKDGVSQALGTLHGLSDFILQALEQPDEYLEVADFSPRERALLQQMCRNDTDTPQEELDQVQEHWDFLAHYFVQQQRRDKEGDSALYIRKGGIMTHVEHGADTSEFRDTCAGSMAAFTFLTL